MDIMRLILDNTDELVNVQNVEYALLTPDELAHGQPYHPDSGITENNASVMAGWLIAVLCISVIMASIIVITAIVYFHCKSKHKMDYQQPQITQDKISHIEDSSDNEHATNCDYDYVKSEGENPIMLPLNVSVLNIHADIDNVDDNVRSPKSGEDALSYSAKTNLLDFEFDPNMNIDEMLPQMIGTVCSHKRTRLIDNSELVIDRMIGKGHYGQVCVGQYDGNRVAIKSFPELDIDNISEFERRKSGSPMIGHTYSASLKQMKSWKSAGYECLDVQDADDDYDDNDAEIRKKIYSRKKEIYSEVVLASSLPSHPNLVQIIGITQNPLNIVMTYYESGNLQNFIYANYRRGRCAEDITLKSILHLFQKIADGISFLHINSIVHRDIAARNVLLGHIQSDGQIHQNTKVVISDFGMTRWIRSINHNQVTKQKVGPIKWMAPESISNRKYSYKSDVYMFGITMFEIMEQREPYTHSVYDDCSLPQLAMKVVQQNRRPIVNQQHQMDSILFAPLETKQIAVDRINKLMQKCWNKSPENRPKMLNVLHSFNLIYDSVLGLTF